MAIEFSISLYAKYAGKVYLNIQGEFWRLTNFEYCKRPKYLSMQMFLVFQTSNKQIKLTN